MSPHNALTTWLKHFKTLHPKAIDFTLDRVDQVANRLEVKQFDSPVITVTGTNGKGSTVALMERMLGCAGYRVGVFSTPAVLQTTEQIRLTGEACTESQLSAAYALVEQARGEILLTEYEALTCAALIVLKQHVCDVIILEVCMGGRRDAVNVVDADIGVITNIGRDHQAWLGDTPEEILYEKAGIIRPGQTVIFGQAPVPDILWSIVEEQHAQLYDVDQQAIVEKNNTWDLLVGSIAYQDLPKPNLGLSNAAVALLAIHALSESFTVPEQAVRLALETACLLGRWNVRKGAVEQIFDVAHNEDAAIALAKRLRATPCEGKTRAVFSMLNDKAIVNTVAQMKDVIDAWYVGPLSSERAATELQLRAAFDAVEVVACQHFPTLLAAYDAALQQSHRGDRMLVFGSFQTVSAVLCG